MALAPLPPEQIAFERLAAEVWRRAASRLSGEARLLATVSPLAVRVPDARLVWHPGLRATARGRLGRALAAEAVGSLTRGIAKVSLRPPRFEAAARGPRGAGVLVVPSALGKAGAGGRFETPYIEIDDERASLVFGPAGSCGAGAAPVPLSRGTLLGLGWRLSAAGIGAAARVPGPAGDRLLLALEWLAWSLAARWAYDLALSRALDHRLAETPEPVVGSVHEMNSIGRTIWAVAERHGCERHALQHAEVTSGKRWYFAQAEELADGVVLPTAMVVYDPAMARDLAPHFHDVRFALGCSRRYAGWKAARLPAPAGAGVALFVGALAPFDNDVVLGALERLARAGSRLPLTLRLHPAAEVPRRSARALARLEADGAVEVSRGRSLADDLARAAVVVGMSTTVLEEALLLRRPAVQLTDDRYLAYIDLSGIAGATVLADTSLDTDALARAASAAVDPAPLRARLGLDQPVVDHAALLDLSLTDAPAPS